MSIIKDKRWKHGASWPLANVHSLVYDYRPQRLYQPETPAFEISKRIGDVELHTLIRHQLLPRPITYELDIPSSTSINGLQPRLPNFYFNDVDNIRLQAAIEIEFRLVRELTNPSPQFLFSRLMTLLHNQGQVNRQALVPYTESWQFFLSDNDHRQMGILKRFHVEFRAVRI